MERNAPRILSLLLLVILLQCTSQNVTTEMELPSPTSTDSDTLFGAELLFVEPDLRDQVSAFVRRIYEDAHGNLWLGTNGDGVACFDGDTLHYFTSPQGFGGLAVRGIIEDQQGRLWVGTENGLYSCSPDTHLSRSTPFTAFTTDHGLPHNDVWSLALDRNGNIWVGTLLGACYFNPDLSEPTVHRFELPESEPDYSRGVTSAWLVHDIMQDHNGHMWFATNSGAYIFDGQTLKLISEADGLCHNVVNALLEDRNGNIWFATHHNGVCRWDGASFQHFGTSDGINGTEAWSLFEDRAGNIWFPIENDGVHRYNADTNSGLFTHFTQANGLASNAVQSIHEDENGTIWMGGYLGLYRYDGRTIQNVTKASFGSAP